MNYIKTLLAGFLVLLACMLPCVRSSAAAAEEPENYAGMTEEQWHTLIKAKSDGSGLVIDRCPYYCATLCTKNYEYGVLYSQYPIKYANGVLYVKGKWDVSVYRLNSESDGELIGAQGYNNGDTYKVLDSMWIVPSDVFLSNHNITYKDLNDVFFHKSPLARLIQSLPLEEMTMKEVMALLPLLIAFLVSVTGFWKGLRFLSRILHKA